MSTALHASKQPDFRALENMAETHADNLSRKMEIK